MSTLRCERFLLLELLNDDPLNQHRCEDYPFIQGFARGRGGQVDWVSVDAGRAERPTHPYVVEPSAHKRAALVALVRDLRPSWIIVNERLGPALGEALRDAAGPAHWLEADPLPLAPILQATTGASKAEAADPFRAGLLSPSDADYSARSLEPDQPRSDHFVTIIAGPRCLYRRGVDGNPHFEGLGLDGLRFPIGCSFCTHHEPRESGNSTRPRAVVEQVLEQMRCYDRTVPAEVRRDRFLVFAPPLFLEMDAFIEGFLGLGLPRTQVHLSGRVDEVLAAATSLREGLSLLARAGHSLHLWQVGLESFSAEENLRFNKGITSQQIEEMIALVTELERAWPETFVFWRHGGFGSIVFTPWTGIEDLRANVEGAARLRLVGGDFMLTSRLQLRRGTPLAALADRDSLISGLAPDGSLEAVPDHSSCITHMGEDELPWRFRDHRVAWIYALMTRLFPRGDTQWDDDLSRRALRPEVVQSDLVRDPLETLSRLLDWFNDHPEANAADALEALAPAGAAASVRPAATGTPALPQALEFLRELWIRIAGAGGTMAGYRPLPPERHWRDHGGAALTLRLRSDVDALVLEVAPCPPGEPCYRRVDTYGLSHATDTPPRSRDAKRALDAVGRLLARCVGAARRIEDDGAP